MNCTYSLYMLTIENVLATEEPAPDCRIGHQSAIQERIEKQARDIRADTARNVVPGRSEQWREIHKALVVIAGLL